MKTRTLLMTLGVAAMTTITINAFAGDAMLSPRAAGNQINRTAGVATVASPADATAATVTPRATGNQILTVAGTGNSATAGTCSKMAGTPKMIAECASHPGAPMPCCAVATAKE